MNSSDTKKCRTCYDSDTFLGCTTESVFYWTNDFVYFCNVLLKCLVFETVSKLQLEEIMNQIWPQYLKQKMVKSEPLVNTFDKRLNSYEFRSLWISNKTLQGMLIQTIAIPLHFMRTMRQRGIDTLDEKNKRLGSSFVLLIPLETVVYLKTRAIEQFVKQKLNQNKLVYYS